MTIGTKSVLFGAHAFWLHPFFVALGWWKLYRWAPALEGGKWPAILDPRAWVAFAIHDLGYLGKPNMDGPEGERHPERAAYAMSMLFDRGWRTQSFRAWTHRCTMAFFHVGRWGHFTLMHSRYYAKMAGEQPSRLCMADKLAIRLTPWWVYLPMVIWTGEIEEYLGMARTHGAAKGIEFRSPRGWWESMSSYCEKWAYEHADGRKDTWTRSRERVND